MAVCPSRMPLYGDGYAPTRPLMTLSTLTCPAPLHAADPTESRPSYPDGQQQGDAVAVEQPEAARRVGEEVHDLVGAASSRRPRSASVRAHASMSEGVGGGEGWGGGGAEGITDNNIRCIRPSIRLSIAPGMHPPWCTFFPECIPYSYGRCLWIMVMINCIRVSHIRT